MVKKYQLIVLLMLSQLMFSQTYDVGFDVINWSINGSQIVQSGSEVTISENIPVELENIKCYSEQIIEPSLDELFSSFILPENLIISSLTINAPSFTQISAQYSSSLSRAPPSFLL